MKLIIAATFTRSLAGLDARARAAVKQAAFDFQVCPRNPGLRLHRLARSCPGFWSLRVDRDLRIIVHRAGDHVVLCHADRHDRAYAWAERRKVVLPAAGETSELIEVLERAEEAVPTPEPRAELPRPDGGGSTGALRDEEDRRTASPRRSRLQRRAAASLSDPVCLGDRGAEQAAPLANLLRLARAREGAPPAAVTAQLGPWPASCRASDVGPAAHGRTGRSAPGAIRALALLAGATIAIVGAVPAAAARCGSADGSRLALAVGAVGALLVGLAARQAGRALSRATLDARDEVVRVRDALRRGSLDVRAIPARADPTLGPVVEALNEAVDAFADPFREATAALHSLAAGRPPPRIARSCGGDLSRHRDAVNALIDFVSLSSEDIQRLVARTCDADLSGGDHASRAGSGAWPRAEAADEKALLGGLGVRAVCPPAAGAG